MKDGGSIVREDFMTKIRTPSPFSQQQRSSSSSATGTTTEFPYNYFDNEDKDGKNGSSDAGPGAQFRDDRGREIFYVRRIKKGSYANNNQKPDGGQQGMFRRNNSSANFPNRQQQQARRWQGNGFGRQEGNRFGPVTRGTSGGPPPPPACRFGRDCRQLARRERCRFWHPSSHFVNSYKLDNVQGDKESNGPPSGGRRMSRWGDKVTDKQNDAEMMEIINNNDEIYHGEAPNNNYNNEHSYSINAFEWVPREEENEDELYQQQQNVAPHNPDVDTMPISPYFYYEPTQLNFFPPLWMTIPGPLHQNNMCMYAAENIMRTEEMVHLGMLPASAALAAPFHPSATIEATIEDDQGWGPPLSAQQGMLPASAALAAPFYPGGDMEATTEDDEGWGPPSSFAEVLHRRLPASAALAAPFYPGGGMGTTYEDDDEGWGPPSSLEVQQGGLPASAALAAPFYPGGGMEPEVTTTRPPEDDEGWGPPSSAEDAGWGPPSSAHQQLNLVEYRFEARVPQRQPSAGGLMSPHNNSQRVQRPNRKIPGQGARPGSSRQAGVYVPQLAPSICKLPGGRQLHRSFISVC